tara:strand:- start:56 stop:442 length:387 start_codon:yes stop_codon:yes gene_type:complete
MRISTKQDDAGYNPVAYKYRAYLDGNELGLCFIADEEKGEAHCWAKDDNGRITHDHQTGKAKIVIFYGKVEIKRLSDFSVAKNRIKQSTIFWKVKRFMKSRIGGFMVGLVAGFIIGKVGFFMAALLNA